MKMIDKERFESTVLEDNADIYNKEQKSEKESFSQMSGKDKWNHFKDYYLLKVLTGMAVIGIVIFIVYSIFKPKVENVLYVAVVDVQLNEDEKLALIEQLEERYGADGEMQKVIIDDSIYTNDDGYTKLEVYLSASSVDVIIANEDVFKEFAALGYMTDMNEFENSANGMFESYYVEAAGYLEEDESTITFEDTQSGRGEVLPYGIDIAGSRTFDKLNDALETPVAGVVINSEHKDNAVEFLKLLIGEED